MLKGRKIPYMETTGIITDISIDFNTLKPKISLVLNTNDKDTIQKLKKEEKLNVEIKKWYQKRSLDANSYCWVLCEKIAQELSKDGNITTKEDIYKEAIKNVGVFVPFIAEEKAFEDFKRIWERQGLGYQVQETARKDKCIRVNCYYGSSSYNTKEMSRLIENLVQECNQLNIETKSKEEIESLLNQWYYQIREQGILKIIWLELDSATDPLKGN